jgi:hypothetical protein
MSSIYEYKIAYSNGYEFAIKNHRATVTRILEYLLADNIESAIIAAKTLEAHMLISIKSERAARSRIYALELEGMTESDSMRRESCLEDIARCERDRF